MLSLCPGFRLGWEQDGRYRTAGMASTIRVIIHNIFILKNFLCCSENKIMAIKPK